MIKPDSRGRLIYGSLEKIKEAINQGAGILYRKDIEILLKEIENVNKNKN